MAAAIGTYNQICNTTGANTGAGTAYPSGAPAFARDS